MSGMVSLQDWPRPRRVIDDAISAMPIDSGTMIVIISASPSSTC